MGKGMGKGMGKPRFFWVFVYFYLNFIIQTSKILFVGRLINTRYNGVGFDIISANGCLCNVIV